jgi:tetratricopeptide (TPR) repeat protein
MKFNYVVVTFLILFVAIVAYPKLPPEDIQLQKELVAAINKDPNNPHLRFELAMEFASTGWIEEGWNQLALVPKLDEDYKVVVYEKYTKIIEEDPDNWKAHFRLAFAHYFYDRKDAAIESFKEVIRIRPDHVWSMGLIALVYGEAKDYKATIKWCKRGIKINNDALAVHFLLGMAYYETGNYFGVVGESLSVARLKAIEGKYRPTPPNGIQQ